MQSHRQDVDERLIRADRLRDVADLIAGRSIKGPDHGGTHVHSLHFLSKLSPRGTDE